MSPAEKVATTLKALRVGLEAQREALLRGDAAGLEAARQVLELALRQGTTLREALKASVLPSTADDRVVLQERVMQLRATAKANARVLVQSRDLTQHVLGVLQTARPILDARA